MTEDATLRNALYGVLQEIIAVCTTSVNSEDHHKAKVRLAEQSQDLCDLLLRGSEVSVLEDAARCWEGRLPSLRVTGHLDGQEMNCSVPEVLRYAARRMAWAKKT